VVLLENGRARSLGADVARDSAAVEALRAAHPTLAAEFERTQQLDRNRSPAR
jgi:hypothetical protein